MPNEVDTLQIKIDKARSELSEEARAAIDAVDWKAAILSMRESKGYSFTQLGDLETETELLLSGLISPADYPKELQARMKITPAQVNEIISEMNEKVFTKIRQELIKNSERHKIFDAQTAISPAPGRQTTLQPKPDAVITEIKKTEPVKSLEPPKLEDIQKEIADGKKTYTQNAPVPPRKPAPASPAAPVSKPAPAIPFDKLSGTFKTPVITTEHTVPSVSSATPASGIKKDPYREIPG